jgi:hypothetical protein
MLQENLKRANMEKTAIELTKSKLSNILLGDTSKPEQKTITTIMSTDKEMTKETKETPNETTIDVSDEGPDLPEPPVVVYVKEVGKAGI